MLSIALILLQSDHRKSASQPAAFPVGNFAAAEKIQASSGSEASSEDESSNKQKQVRINCNWLLTLYIAVDVIAAFDLDQ